MALTHRQRGSEHWLVEAVLTGEISDGAAVRRPAEPRWHLVVLDGPGLAMDRLVDAEIGLAERGRRTFELLGSQVAIAEGEDAESMVDRLARDGVLAFDPLVGRVLAGHRVEAPERTVRHRVRTATGQSGTRIGQVERAKRAAVLIAGGLPLARVAAEAGYTDQPHLTRSVRRWLGATPGALRG